MNRPYDSIAPYSKIVGDGVLDVPYKAHSMEPPHPSLTLPPGHDMIKNNENGG